MKNANPVSLLLLLGLGLLAPAGCDRTATVSAVDSADVGKTFTDWFTIDVGGVKARVQLAVQTSELEQGLMRREDLGDNDGMLFVFPAPQTMNFWMKNTPTPLDIAYFSPDGRLAEVHAATPYDETVISSESPRLQFVLEMKQGWFSSHGLRSGAQLDLGAVAEAMRQRGFTPIMYGLHE